MHLGINRKTAHWQIRNLVETLDDVAFPKRSAEIDWTGMQARHLDTQLAPVAGRRQSDMPQMKLNIEIIVEYPIRAIHSAGHFDQARAENWHALQALLVIGEQVLKAYETTRRSRRVVDT